MSEPNGHPPVLGQVRPSPELAVCNMDDLGKPSSPLPRVYAAFHPPILARATTPLVTPPFIHDGSSTMFGFLPPPQQSNLLAPNSSSVGQTSSYPVAHPFFPPSFQQPTNQACFLPPSGPPLFMSPNKPTVHDQPVLHSPGVMLPHVMHSPANYAPPSSGVSPVSCSSAAASEGTSASDSVSPQKALRHMQMLCESCVGGNLTVAPALVFLLQMTTKPVKLLDGGYGIKNPAFEEPTLPSAGLVTLKGLLSCPLCKDEIVHLLNHHIKNHGEVKPYLCIFCCKAFSDNFDLRRHTRIHTGLKPYKCKYCSTAFPQRCFLESHMRKVHGPHSYKEQDSNLYTCEDCGHASQEPEAYLAHLHVFHKVFE